MRLRLKEIRTDGGTQPRASINREAVAEYAEAMQEGATFPPPAVFYDGADYWLADGFHRVAAAKAAGFEDVTIDLRQGSRRDAILFSVGVNSTHGLRRTNEDKRRAVLTLLNDPEWVQFSDREIARRCGVGNKFVGDVRRSVFGTHSTAQPAENTGGRIGADGRVRPVSQPKPMPAPEPEHMPNTSWEPHPEWDEPEDFEPEPLPQPTPGGVLVDANGEIVPEQLVESWRLAEHITSAIARAIEPAIGVAARVKSTRTRLSSYFADNGIDPETIKQAMGSGLIRQGQVIDLDNAISSIEHWVAVNRPHVICQRCQGSRKSELAHCGTCVARGFVGVK